MKKYARIRTQKTFAASLLCLFSVSGCASLPEEFNDVASFKEIGAAFKHQWHDDVHPFTGAAVIDIDGDGAEEIFVGGSQNQPDTLLSLRNNELVDIIEGTGLSNPAATYGPISIDVDNNGNTDLVVARYDGVYLHLNTGGKFSTQKLPLALPENSVPLSVAASDIDRDGDADLYISVFVDSPNFRSAVFNDPDHAKSNILLLNDGNGEFTDITQFSGTAGSQNTFLSAFVDLDNDGWQDLVVSQNTGEVEIFRNNHDRTFRAIATNTGFGFWMGIAAGDIDHDGDQDLFFSNAGDSIPAFLTSGDLRDDQNHNLNWALLRNDGDFRFTNVATDMGIKDEGFAWGAVFEDIDLDGHLDLLVAQNYIKWPVHQLFPLEGRSYLRSANDGRFYHVEGLGLENPHFGQSPIIADLNNDNRPDVIWLNMDGPVRAFINQTENPFLSIQVPDTVRFLGTTVHLESSTGRSYTREVVNSTGMLSDQSPNLVFGMERGESVQRVVVQFPDGETVTVENPAINTELQLDELR
ncbi:MAG: CRTAC1 family protein [Pseudomonadota bacterium]